MLLEDEKRLQKKLIKSFNLILGIGIGLLSMLTIGLVWVLIMVSKMSWCFFLISPFLIFFWWQLIPYIKDLKAVRTRSFQVAIGKIVGYKKFKTRASFAVRWLYNPIVKDETTGEEIELDVNIGQYATKGVKNPEEVGVGEKYIFLYLKNSKLAVAQKIEIQETTTNSGQ